MRRLLLLLLSLSLGACASGGVDFQFPKHSQPTSLGEVLANIKGDALIDLDAAMAIAVAHKDPYGMACFPVLKKYLAPATGVTTVDKVVGVFSAYEKLTVERMALEANGGGMPGLPADLKIACAAKLQNDLEFYARLDALIAGGIVPGVGAIAPLLPK
jgi:hypothetical protein